MGLTAIARFVVTGSAAEKTTADDFGEIIYFENVMACC